MKLISSHTGFSLVELMMVIVIVAALLLVALPAYQNQIIRGHRAAAKAEMLEIGNRQEQYLLSDRTYTDDLADLSYTTPPDVAVKYTFSLSTVSAGGLPAFLITATPGGTQADDGALTLNNLGEGLPEDKWSR